jgi:hypothetical protein
MSTSRRARRAMSASVAVLVAAAPVAVVALRPFESLRVAPSKVEGRQAQGRPPRSRCVSGSTASLPHSSAPARGRRRCPRQQKRCERRWPSAKADVAAIEKEIK